MSAPTYTTTDVARVLTMLRANASVAAVVAATGIHDNTIRAWARRAGVAIYRKPAAPPPPAKVYPRYVRRPRVIPREGCGHFAMGHRSVCTACRVDLAEGRAVRAVPSTAGVAR